jgi:hypothetical protein
LGKLYLLAYGGLILGLSQLTHTTPAASKNDSLLKSSQINLKNHLALLI